MKFFKFLITQSPLLKSVFDYHHAGKVSFEYPETDTPRSTKRL